MKEDMDRHHKDSDELVDHGAPAIYAPNSRHWTELKLPPGVNPESLVCYASIDGQD